MRGIFHLGIVALAFHVLPASQAHAASLIAANCSSASVQAAISNAIDGDTVVIPTGSCTWTSGIITNKQIIISGQAKGSVLITHAAGSNPLLDLTTGSKYSTEVRNINFLVSSGTGHYMRIGGTGMPPLIHDNYFNVPDFQLSGCIHFERNGGVIWNNVFESLTSSGTGGSSGAGSGCLQLKNGSGGASWSAASTMGTADVTGTANVYIEDNIFNNIYLQSIDCDDNARTVVRHNTFNDSGFACHGADTSPYGARHTEVYDNTFVFHGTGSNGSIKYPLNLNWWWYVRGGTGIVTDNSMPDINSSTWGNKAEINFIVQQLRRNAGPNACCTSYPCLHQIGQSHDGSSLITEPIYIWNNVGTGGRLPPGLSDYDPDQCGNNLHTSDFVKAGRDYVVDVAKPGWAKYPYPHPLTGRGQSAASPPSAPSNLTVK